jgi:hypothetical protein
MVDHLVMSQKCQKPDIMCHRLSGDPIDPIHTPFGGNVLFLNIA